MSGEPLPSRTTARWALGLSVVPVTTVVSLALAYVVLRRGRDGQDHGNRIAIAALAIVSGWVLACLASVGTVVVHDVRHAADHRAGVGDVSPRDLRVGDCIARVPTGERVSRIALAPCGHDHAGEVFAEFTLPAGRFPGADQVTRLAFAGCTQRYPGRDATGLFFLSPKTATLWSARRRVVCVAVGSDPSGAKLA